MIHLVPTPPKEGSDDVREPRLSDVADPQTPQVRTYFRDRLQGVMTQRGQAIEPDPKLDAEATDAVKAVLSDPKTLVEKSKVLARRLYASQDGRSSEGILVVALAKLNGRPAVGLLKLEHERGVQAEEKTVNGKRQFTVVLHEDLMLTKRTAVFKAAAFQLTTDNAPKLRAIASDLQVEQNLAGFFLGSFLGCRLVQKASVKTQEYFDAAESFIRGVDNPERRARYEIALLNQMHSSAVTTINPTVFSNSNLDAADRPSFRQHLDKADVGQANFAKDTSAIEGRIKRMAYEFESGIKVMGTPDAMSEHVEIDGSAGDGLTTVTVRDQMSDVRARG